MVQDNEHLRGLRVLVAEDEPLLAQMIKDYLEDLNCIPVGPAYSLSAAILLASTAEMDVAVVNRRLRNEEADDLVRVLASRHIPVVLATGASVGDIGHEAEGRVVLLKPFGRPELAQAIAKAVKHHE